MLDIGIVERDLCAVHGALEAMLHRTRFALDRIKAMRGDES
jgi:hypothetical protein